MNIIHNLRQRPEEERNAVALMIAGGVALTLFLLWGMMFFRTSQTTIAKIKGSPVSSESKVTDITSSIADLTKQVVTQYSDLQKVIQNKESASVQNSVTISDGKNGNVRIKNVTGPIQKSTSTVFNIQTNIDGASNTNNTTQ